MTLPSDLQVYRRLFARDLEANHSPKTKKIYTNAVDHFARYLDELPAEAEIEEGLLVTPGAVESITDTTRHHIKDFLRWMKDQKSQRDGGPWSASYRSSIFRGLQAFWKWMVVEDHCPNNPTANVDGPKVTEEPVPVLEQDELRALVGTCGKGAKRPFVDVRDEAILRLLLDAGLRCSEMIVTLDKVNTNHNTIAVVGKGRDGKPKYRTAHFGAKTASALDKYFLARAGHPGAGATDQLWVGRWGPLTSSGIYQTVVDRGVEVGLKLHPHQLRHTCALHLKLRGESDAAIMAQMGWDSPTMVIRYGRIAKSRVASEAIKRNSLGDLI